jgi:hypothetical protein
LNSKSNALTFFNSHDSDQSWVISFCCVNNLDDEKQEQEIMKKGIQQIGKLKKPKRLINQQNPNCFYICLNFAILYLFQQIQICLSDSKHHDSSSDLKI